MKRWKLLARFLAVATAIAGLSSGAIAGGQYDAGASDTTIRIGQTLPYSGPASAYGQYGRAEAAYFRMINEQGGINGRKIEFESLDDAYSPPKTVELTRHGKLLMHSHTATRRLLSVAKRGVEDDDVFFRHCG